MIEDRLIVVEEHTLQVTKHFAGHKTLLSIKDSCAQPQALKSPNKNLIRTKIKELPKDIRNKIVDLQAVCVIFYNFSFEIVELSVFGNKTQIWQYLFIFKLLRKIMASNLRSHQKRKYGEECNIWLQ